MLTNKDLYTELKFMEEVAEKEKDIYKKYIIKGIILQLKLLHNIRTNQTLLMQTLGATKIQPKVKNETKEERD